MRGADPRIGHYKQSRKSRFLASLGMTKVRMP